MIKNIKKSLSGNIVNILGWQTNRKIVVIESDDWGSIRMASKESYNILLKSGYPVDLCPFNRYDALESNEDLEMLFEVLSSVKDKNGSPAIMTADMVVANPDFEKIQESDFQEYYYEPFTETLVHYPGHDRVMDLYKEGIEHKIFYPQFHGREHLNVNRWMNALRRGDKDAHAAFMHKMFSVHNLPKPDNLNEYMDSLGYDSLSEKEHLAQIITEGLSLFGKIWGFNSKSFIASCYIWSSDIEKTLFGHGVNYIQGMLIQSEPALTDGITYKKKYHYQGQKNSYGQRYLIRNAFFEPNEFIDFDWVSDCINRISFAFRWNKPAIISTHRKNFIGFIDPSNRDRNLQLLKTLISKLLERWPEVEFMTSDQLGDLMNGN